MVMMMLLALIVCLTGMSVAEVTPVCDNCTCTCSYIQDLLHVNCSGLEIETLPSCVPNNTYSLSLRNNRFLGVDDDEFSRLTNLSYLDLSVNNVSRIRQHGFRGLSELVGLDLSSNELDFDLTKVHLGSFKPLQKLTDLILWGNRYAEYPDSHLRYLKSLVNISLDGVQNATFRPGFMFLEKLRSVSIAGTESSYCNITSIHNMTFENVRNITSLNISYCNISYIEPGAFSSLQQIDTLDLSYNSKMLFYGVRNATKGLETSKLRRLVINHIVPDCAVCVVIDASIVEYLENTSLQIIEANYNRIEMLTNRALAKLPKTLHTVSVKGSRFTIGPYLKRLDLLENLTVLDMSGQSVILSLLHDLNTEDEDKDHSSCTWHPPTQQRDEHEIMTTAHEDVLIHKPIRNSNATVNIPPQLEKLNYSFSELNYRLSNINMPDTKLKIIDLSYNVLTVWGGPVFGVENVTHLNLSNNIAHNVSYTFFENFKSLKFLNLSRNYLERSFFKDTPGLIFRNMSKLETLDLSYNALVLLSHHFLEGLVSLKTLKIKENSIVSLGFNFSSNKNLNFIDASNNQIEFLPANVRDDLDELGVKNNLSIDFSWNPFACSCDPDSQLFLDWLHTTKVNFINKHHYMCVVYNKTRRNFKSMKTRYRDLKEECKVYVAVTMVLLTIVVFFTSTVLCGIMYRFRWRAIYFYYSGKRWFRNKQFIYRMSYEEIWEFDAFVSYADEDLEFVRPLMLSRLETDQGLSLYIRHRDSTPGDNIADQIFDGIQRSRRSIIIVSRASLKSKWCTYEMQMAKMEEISTKRRVLILVMLEGVSVDDIPTEILNHAKGEAPFQYSGDEYSELNLFWASLAEDVRA